MSNIFSQYLLKITLNTVNPVYNDYPWDPKIVADVDVLVNPKSCSEVNSILTGALKISKNHLQILQKVPFLKHALLFGLSKFSFGNRWLSTVEHHLPIQILGVRPFGS